MSAPDAFRRWEVDYREDELTAQMAMIDRLDEIAGQLQRLNENLERGHR